MTRVRALGLAVTVVALAASVSACGSKAKTPTVASAWPQASVERTVPKPPQPPKWPLTGLPGDKTSLVRRALSIKIENSPDARPQMGLNSADVVYETIAEGGITRFNAIFQSKIPDRVGPVRSARLSDLWIVPQYNAIFFFSGASGSVNAAVRQAGLPNMSEDAGVSFPYTRVSFRVMPHNLYMSPKKGYEEAKKRGYKITGAPSPLAFEKKVSATATPTATNIVIPFSAANTSKWQYDPMSGF